MKRALHLTRKHLGFLLMAGLLSFGNTLNGYGADKPSFRIELFHAPDYLENSAEIQEASGDQWSNLAKLVHFVVVPDKNKLDASTQAKIQTWEEQNRAKLVVISQDDPKIKRLPLPRMKINLYGKTQELEYDEAFQTNTVEEKFFQLMGEDFDQKYQSDTETDWVKDWLSPMQALSSESLLPRYVKLGKDRLSRVNPQSDVSIVPLEDSSSSLSVEDRDQLLKTAIDAFSKAIEEKPDAANSNSLGVSYYYFGDYENAEKRFQQAVQRERSSKTYRLNLARTHVKLKKKQEALEILQPLNQTDPDVKSIRLHLAQTDANQGNKQGALEVLRPLEPNAPDVKPILLHLARTDVNQGNKQGALEVLELLNPKDQEVKKLRDQLRGRDTGAWLNTGAFLVLAGGSVALAATARGDADNAFENAQSISPPQPIVAEEPTPALNPADLEKQSNDWEEYRKLDRRAIMGNITALNFAVNSVPFVLDGGNKKLAEKKWWIGYLLKSGIFIGFSIKSELERGDAEDKEKEATLDEDKPYYRGLREQAEETRNLCFANAVIDLVTAGLFHFWSDPQDGLSVGSEAEQPLMHNPAPLPIDLSYRSNGKNDHELRLLFRKPF
jgi:tetratricopeptide (TPR) repeat protein